MQIEIIYGMIAVILFIAIIIICNKKTVESYTIYPDNETLIQNSILEMYPIGMVVINTTGNNPNTIKGLEDTEWELISDDSQKLIVSKRSTKSNTDSSLSTSYSTSISPLSSLESEATKLTEYDIPPHTHKIDVDNDDWSHKHTVTSYQTTKLSSVNSDDSSGYFSSDGGTTKWSSIYKHKHDATADNFPKTPSDNPSHKHRIRVPHVNIFMWKRIK